MSGIAYRQATLADAGDILTLLIELAPEIPLLVDTLEREEALYALIRTWARSGESWVACDETGQIVGVALAERAEHRRHYAEHEIVELRYAAARAMAGGEGIVAGLIDQIVAGMVPVVATVGRQNATGLAAILAAKGFRPAAESSSEGRYRWQPGD